MYLKIIIIVFIFVGGIFEVQASDEVTWKPLKKGDKIHLFASGFAVEASILEKAKHVIKSYGYEPVAPDDLITAQPFGFANTEHYRGEHLNELLLNSEVKVLWAVRGGRGTSAILPYLENLNSLPSLRSKVIVGFSDVTALHLWAFSRDIPSIHGVNLTTNSEFASTVNGKTSLASVIKILSGEDQALEYPLSPINETAQSNKSPIASKIVGGNISLIQRSIGTSTSLRPAKCVVFLEETGEVPTRFLEIMTQFKRSNLFEEVQAIILGDFIAGQSQEASRDFESLFKLFGQQMDEKHIPVFSSPLFGHGDYNEPLPFNMPATITIEDQHKAILRIKTTS